MISGAENLVEHAGRGFLSRPAQPDQRQYDDDVGATRVFQAADANPWFALEGALRGATSFFYDTSELKTTLESSVDFDLLNNGRKRLSVGAVNVRTGNFIYFDSRKMRIEAEHIMASGCPALPGLPRHQDRRRSIIGTAASSPTRRCNICLTRSRRNFSLVFRESTPSLSAGGELPRQMSDVIARQKDITYSSRTRQNTDSLRVRMRLKMRLLERFAAHPGSESDRLTKRS